MSNELITISSSEITGLQTVVSLGFFGAYKDSIVELAPGYFESSSSSESSLSSESSTLSTLSSESSSASSESSSDLSSANEYAPCGTPVSYGGGLGTHYTTITLGSDTGTVLFTFNAYTVPDRFVVTWNGIDVIDTGFRGSSSYNTWLVNNGYTTVTGGGAGTASFVKSLSNPQTALVTVYGPIPGTAWSFSMDCPI